MSSAILLMAHGSRRASANADLVRLAEKIRPRVSAEEYPIIEISYLELAEPSIPDGLRKCVASGATHVRMLPFFLSAGSHVSRDLEQFRADFLAEHPGIVCDLCPPLGLHDGVLDALLARLEEVFQRS